MFARWRSRSCSRWCDLCTPIGPLDAPLAKMAGEATAKVKGATLIDAVVMAAAARTDGVVYTSDFDDLTRLQAVFPAVRVLSTS